MFWLLNAFNLLRGIDIIGGNIYIQNRSTCYELPKQSLTSFTHKHTVFLAWINTIHWLTYVYGLGEDNVNVDLGKINNKKCMHGNTSNKQGK